MIRGRVATKVIDAVTNHYGFRVGKDPADIEHNKNKRLDLLRDNAFVYKVLFLCSISDCVSWIVYRISIHRCRLTTSGTASSPQFWALSSSVKGMSPLVCAMRNASRSFHWSFSHYCGHWYICFFIFFSPHNAHMCLDSLCD
jgi:hypothetical protein